MQSILPKYKIWITPSMTAKLHLLNIAILEWGRKHFKIFVWYEAVLGKVFCLGFNNQFQSNIYVWFEVNIIIFFQYYVTNFSCNKSVFSAEKSVVFEKKLKLVLYEVEDALSKTKIWNWRDFFVLYSVIPNTVAQPGGPWGQCLPWNINVYGPLQVKGPLW